MGRVPGAPGRRSRPLQTELARTQSSVMALVSHKPIDIFYPSCVLWRSQYGLCMFLLLCRKHQHGIVLSSSKRPALSFEHQYGMMSWQQHRALASTPTDCQPSPIFCPSHCDDDMLPVSHYGFYPTLAFYCTQETACCLPP